MNLKGAVMGFLVGGAIGLFMGQYILTNIGASLDSFTSEFLQVWFPFLVAVYGAREGSKLR